jgi:hypothetical protein
MKLGIRIVAALLVVALLAGCAAHTHKVGAGARGFDKTEDRQWYILWGLVPLNDIDSATMAGEATDYTVYTEVSAIDFFINIVTSIVTVNARTVTVTK